MSAACPIVVLGATGAVGTALVERLRASGQHVRAAGRDTRLLARLGAQATVQGSLDDPQHLARACHGAATVVACVPIHRTSGSLAAHGERLARMQAEAIRAAAPARVLVLSCLAAAMTPVPGPAAGAAGLEAGLSGTSLAVRILRAAPHLEALGALLPVVRRTGTLPGLLRPDVRRPLIAARDVAQAAAALLAASAWEAGTVVQELHGAKDYDGAAVAGALGKAFDLPGCAYAPLARPAWERQLQDLGWSADAAHAQAELDAAWDEGRVPRGPRTSATTTATTLGQGLRQLRAAGH